MDYSYYSYFRDSLAWFEREREGPRRTAGGPGRLRLGADPGHYAAGGALEAGRGQAAALGRSIRPDGELMLYLLAREFVAKPATAVRGLPEAEVGHLLQADVSEVVERSARGSESEELSAHALLDTVSSRWDGLRSASLEIWGP